MLIVFRQKITQKRSHNDDLDENNKKKLKVRHMYNDNILLVLYYAMSVLFECSVVIIHFKS